MHAVKAALDEGIVPGGGVTLINLTNAVTTTDGNDSVNAGKELLKKPWNSHSEFCWQTLV